MAKDYTTYYSLVKPAPGSYDWDGDVNDNFDTIDTTLNSLATGKANIVDGAVEDNFASFDSDGDIQDSGYSDASYEDAGTMTTHESTYTHSNIHVRLHTFANSLDHSSLVGAVEDDFVTLDVGGYPQASGVGLVLTVGDPGSDTELVSEQGIREALDTHLSDHTHANLHARDHVINATADHDGVPAATTDNVMSFDANALPKDSGKAASDIHTRDHGINSTSDHDGAGGTENNFITFNSDGLFKDSGLALVTTVGDPGSDSSVPSEQAVREVLHDRDHVINATADHDGVSGATEDNFMSFDANALPKDSGYSDASYADADHDATHITAGSDEIDGDQLDIDWNPTNYTPATNPAQVSSVDHLTAHLYGIDQAIATAVAHTLGSATHTDVTISSPADNEVLAYDSGSTDWINQTAAEAGLAVSGHNHDSDYAALLHAATHIRAGSDEVDGDKLDIDFTPSVYTPSTAPAEADHVDNLTAHLKGIDTKLTNIDVSDDTNLSATAPIVLTGDDISFGYTAISGYNASNTQVLCHVTGTLTWVDTDVCP